MHFRRGVPTDVPRIAELWGGAYKTTSTYKAFVSDGDINDLIKMEESEFEEWMTNKTGSYWHVMVADVGDQQMGVEPGTIVAAGFMELVQPLAGAAFKTDGDQTHEVIFRYASLPGADVHGCAGAKIAFDGFKQTREAGGDHYLLLAFCVDSLLHRQGLGRKLGAHCLQIARARNTPVYLLAVHEAKSFYSKMGFVTVPGSLPYKFPGDTTAKVTLMAHH